MTFWDLHISAMIMYLELFSLDLIMLAGLAAGLTCAVVGLMKAGDWLRGRQSG